MLAYARISAATATLATLANIVKFYFYHTRTKD